MQVTEVLADAATETANQSPAEVEITGEPTGVYRFYDTAGSLLYVGISSNLSARWAKHATDKPWWLQVARRTVVMYGSRGEAEEAESTAILTESPIHNVAGREAKPERKAARGRPSLAPRWAGPVTFEPDAKFLATIDAFAESRKTSRGHAIGQLVLAGLVRNHHLDQGTMEDLDAELAAMDAYHEARKAGLLFPSPGAGA